MKKILLTTVIVLIACIFAAAQDVTTNKTDSKGHKQGVWEEKTATSTTKGLYQDDKKEGTWITYGSTGFLNRIDEYVKGLHEGISVEIDQRGYLVSEFYYKNDLLEGTEKKYFYGSNPASTIDYKQGKLNGKRRLYYENSAGKLSEESEFKDDIKNGPSNFFTISGDPVAEYNYVNGMLEGIQKTYYPGKKIMSEENYVNNVESGSYKEYYDTGKVKLEGSYRNGKMDGKWTEYDADGKVKTEGSYVNGDKEGKWTEYDAAGKPLKVTKYIKGVEKN